MESNVIETELVNNERIQDKILEHIQVIEATLNATKE